MVISKSGAHKLCYRNHFNHQFSTTTYQLVVVKGLENGHPESVALRRLYEKDIWNKQSYLFWFIVVTLIYIPNFFYYRVFRFVKVALCGTYKRTVKTFFNYIYHIFYV